MRTRTHLIALIVTVCVPARMPRIGPATTTEKNGTSGGEGAVTRRPKEGPKVLWTVPVGIGFGGPRQCGRLSARQG